MEGEAFRLKKNLNLILKHLILKTLILKDFKDKENWPIMDNELQIEEIRKFHSDLTNQGQVVDENNAALMWIEKNAESWRSNHGVFLATEWCGSVGFAEINKFDFAQRP